MQSYPPAVAKVKTRQVMMLPLELLVEKCFLTVLRELATPKLNVI